MKDFIIILVVLLLFFILYPSDKDIKKTLEMLSGKKTYNGGTDSKDETSLVNEFGIIKGLPNGSGTSNRSYGLPLNGSNNRNGVKTPNYSPIGLPNSYTSPNRRYL